MLVIHRFSASCRNEYPARLGDPGHSPCRGAGADWTPVGASGRAFGTFPCIHEAACQRGSSLTCGKAVRRVKMRPSNNLQRVAGHIQPAGCRHGGEVFIQSQISRYGLLD